MLLDINAFNTIVQLRRENKSWREIAETITNLGYRTKKGTAYNGIGIYVRAIRDRPNLKSPSKLTHKVRKPDFNPSVTGSEFKDLVRHVINSSLKNKLDVIKTALDG